MLLKTRTVLTDCVDLLKNSDENFSALIFHFSLLNLLLKGPDFFTGNRLFAQHPLLIMPGK